VAELDLVVEAFGDSDADWKDDDCDDVDLNDEGMIFDRSKPGIDK
jgi:hypothetical protein